MSVGMSVLCLLEERPMYGLQLKQEFEARTGWAWVLNVGQVYTTLGRLERDGLVASTDEVGSERQKRYEITRAGRDRLEEWFDRPVDRVTPSRDELVLKLVMALWREPGTAETVVQAERKAGVELLQRYTRLKADAPTDGDLGWVFLLDSLIYQTEARVRWLDACEARLRRATRPLTAARPQGAPLFARLAIREEVRP